MAFSQDSDYKSLKETHVKKMEDLHKNKNLPGTARYSKLVFHRRCPNHFCFTGNGAKEGGLRNSKSRPLKFDQGHSLRMCLSLQGPKQNFHLFNAPSLSLWQKPVFSKRNPFQQGEIGELPFTSVNSAEDIT